MLTLSGWGLPASPFALEGDITFQTVESDDFVIQVVLVQIQVVLVQLDVRSMLVRKAFLVGTSCAHNMLSSTQAL